LRKATKWSVWPTDADPRGMTVVDAHREPVGLVTDLWVDREIKILRYMEVDLAATPGSVLLPIYAAEVRRKRREVMVPGLVAEQFVNVPRLADADRISAREEDQVNAYYAGGAFFNRESGALGRRRGRRTRR
jgi:photosynthetic reaction center H subunit